MKCFWAIYLIATSQTLSPTPPHPTSPQEKRSKVLTQPPHQTKKIKKTLSEKSHPLWKGDINRIAPTSYQSQRTLGTIKIGMALNGGPQSEALPP